MPRRAAAARPAAVEALEHRLLLVRRQPGAAVERPRSRRRWRRSRSAARRRVVASRSRSASRARGRGPPASSGPAAPWCDDDQVAPCADQRAAAAARRPRRARRLGVGARLAGVAQHQQLRRPSPDAGRPRPARRRSPRRAGRGLGARPPRAAAAARSAACAAGARRRRRTRAGPRPALNAVGHLVERCAERRAARSVPSTGARAVEVAVGRRARGRVEAAAAGGRSGGR